MRRALLSGESNSTRISRREALGGAAALAAAGLLGALDAETAAGRRAGRRRKPRKPTVAVLGAGVGGLTAAHELAERGFAVTIYEPRQWGGKSRSYGVPGTARGGRRPLPAEHGPRFFPGYYQHVTETMYRIPFPGNRDGVMGNIETVPYTLFPRSGGRRDLLLPNSVPPKDPYLPPEAVREMLLGYLQEATVLPLDALAHFVQRILVMCASCEARRYGEWEQVSWWDYIAADRYPKEYGQLLGHNWTRVLNAAKATEMSGRTGGYQFVQSLYSILGRGQERRGTGPFDRILNAPTSDAFIDPWIAYLRSLGVRLRLPYAVTALELRDGRIAAARVRGPRGRETVVADHYVCALPVERARRLWSPAIRAADPQLAQTDNLRATWLVSLQYFLSEQTPIVHGHVAYVDAPWGLQSLSQAQFWPGRNFARDYGDGRARDVMSVAIDEWEVPGVVYGRKGRELSAPEIAREVWEQMKQALNDSGEQRLRDDVLLSWYLDPGLQFRRGRPVDAQDRIFINTPRSWEHRPAAGTAIPNLFLASDYVRTNMDLASMEAANEAARQAVNTLLEVTGSREEPAMVTPLYRPPEWEPFQRIDEERYRLGQPNLFDTDAWPGLPLSDVTRQAVRSAQS